VTTLVDRAKRDRRFPIVRLQGTIGDEHCGASTPLVPFPGMVPVALSGFQPESDFASEGGCQSALKASQLNLPV